VSELLDQRTSRSLASNKSFPIHFLLNVPCDTAIRALRGAAAAAAAAAAQWELGKLCMASVARQAALVPAWCRGALQNAHSTGQRVPRSAAERTRKFSSSSLMICFGHGCCRTPRIIWL
jgi:hypothetical protein